MFSAFIQAREPFQFITFLKKIFLETTFASTPQFFQHFPTHEKPTPCPQGTWRKFHKWKLPTIKESGRSNGQSCYLEIYLYESKWRWADPESLTEGGSWHCFHLWDLLQMASSSSEIGFKWWSCFLKSFKGSLSYLSLCPRWDSA